MIQLQVQTVVGVDLNTLPTEKLVQIREQADLRIKSRQKRKNALIADLLIKDNNCHTRIGFCVAKLLDRKLKDITLSEISKLSKSTFLKMPNMGVKSLFQLNAILLANGYEELKD